MNKPLIKRLGFTVILFFIQMLSYAQSAADSTSFSIDTALRSNGKIYVVMAVCIVILIVLFLYLIRIDSKISRREKKAGI